MQIGNLNFTEENYRRVHERLLKEFTPAGACGIEANMLPESLLRADNLQNSTEKKLKVSDSEYVRMVDDGTYSMEQFARDSGGFGLCQWTFWSRKQELWKLAKSKGVSIADIDMQIDFMLTELKRKKSLYNLLTTSNDCCECAIRFMMDYEKPGNQSEENQQKRASYALEFYSLLFEEDIKMIKPVDYKQTDKRWKSVKYAVDGESSTIGSAGCGPTVLADILASLVSPYIDPLTTASWARHNKHNYKVKNSGTSYSYPAAQGAAYGVQIARLNTSNVYGQPTHAIHQRVLEELKKGNWVIACMGKGNWTSSGHFILVYGYEGGYVFINDPASNKSSRLKNTFQLFSSQVKYYWIVRIPDLIKANGIVAEGDYSDKEFYREVQLCIGAGVDEIPGSQTLSKTVTVSKKKNRTHNVVLPLQKYLKKRGLYQDTLDRVAGNNFDVALKAYQTWMPKPDGEATAKGTTWKRLLGL